MKGGRGELSRALPRLASGEVRLFLFHGADEAGSRTLAAQIGRAMGAEAERIDLAPSVLKSDPARLADEAAATSLFGGPRHIRVEGAGDESIAAVEALLEAPAAGNPVALVAGQLRATSRLLKLVLAAKGAMAVASYPPDARELEQIAGDLGRAAGLRIDPDMARRLGAAAGNDRAILASEIDKLALSLDADAAAPKDLTHEQVDALSADSGEADLNRLAAAILAGEPEAAEAEIARLAAIGTRGVPLVRAVQRRLLQLADLRAEVEAGHSIATVLARPQSGVYPRERPAVERQLRRWTAERLATAIGRLAEAGRAAMSSAGPGDLAIEAELGIIARNAARAR